MAEPFISGKGISFRLFGFPVLYRWSALALPVLFGFQIIDPRDGIRALEAFTALALAIAAAVLVHELGHALTSRAFGGKARIELVFLGGLTYHEYDTDLTNGKRALVSVAGSVAGAAAAVAVAVVFRDAVFDPDTVWESGVRFFVYAGAVWGIFNLVPLPGLDGSHILDAGVRAVAPKAAPVVVPVATAFFAIAAIAAMYAFAGIFGAFWLIIIFGPELVALPDRIRQGRDQPLAEQARAAEAAYRRGDLEQAVALSSQVLEAAGTAGLRAPMIEIKRHALSKLGRPAEMLDLDHAPGVHPAPQLMRARALAATGRLAEAESEARQVIDLPEAGSLVAELLVAQDLDERAVGVVTPEAARLLARRVVVLEGIDPSRAKRLARVIASAPGSTALVATLAHMSLGQAPQVDGLDARERWMVEIEWAARIGDTPMFEHAVRQIPDPVASYLAQERLHLLGKYDQAARLGSVSGSNGAAQYLLARSFARTGQADRAIEALDHAVSAGWSDAPEAVTEPDLAPLHGDRQWRSLLDRMASQA